MHIIDEHNTRKKKTKGITFIVSIVKLFDKDMIILVSNRSTEDAIPVGIAYITW